MEEKERYEIHMYDDCRVDLYDKGVLDKSITNEWELGKLLNQQSKRIKELEQENVDNTTPVANLDLSVRTTNLLVRGGIKTISDLENASFDTICGLRNMGWKSIEEIYDKLIDLKFKRSKK